VVLVVLATLGTAGVRPALETYPVAPYIIAVSFAAWFGGLGPGLLATALSAVTLAYFFVPPYFTLRVESPPDVLRLGLFATASATVTWVCHLLRRALREVLAGAERLSASEAQFRRLVAGVTDYAIFGLDADGCVTSWNAGAERIKGYRADEILGRQYETFFTPEDRAAGRPRALLARAAGEGRVEDEGWRLRQDGRRFWASAVLTALRDDDGRLVGFSKVARDLTERRAAELALQEQALELELANQQLLEQADELRAALAAAERDQEAAVQARGTAEAANAAKGQFLAVMSHELRTPLNAISGYVQLLEMGLHGPVTGEQRRALGRVDHAQRRLLGLINDVLNYARLESGRVEYEIAPVRVSDVVTDVRPMVEPQLAAKGLAFDVRLPEDAGARPAVVWADREKLAQVLLNLLANAIKFTPPGGQVRVELAERRGGSGPPECVCLAVTDTGIGIPASRLHTLFEPFVQVRADLTRTAEGTGLGLAISRDLARGMGGDLDVRSVEGEGSTFTVSLRRVETGAGELVDRRTGEERRVDAERRAATDRRSGVAALEAPVARPDGDRR
jgi:PAS domain S-box-containing protein